MRPIDARRPVWTVASALVLVAMLVVAISMISDLLDTSPIPDLPAGLDDHDENRGTRVIVVGEPVYRDRDEYRSLWETPYNRILEGNDASDGIDTAGNDPDTGNDPDDNANEQANNNDAPVDPGPPPDVAEAARRLEAILEILTVWYRPSDPDASIARVRFAPLTEALDAIPGRRMANAAVSLTILSIIPAGIEVEARFPPWMDAVYRAEVVIASTDSDNPFESTRRTRAQNVRRVDAAETPQTLPNDSGEQDEGESDGLGGEGQENADGDERDERNEGGHPGEGD